MDRLDCILCDVAREWFWVRVTDGIPVIRVLLWPPTWSGPPSDVVVLDVTVENTGILLRSVSFLLRLQNNPSDLGIWDLEVRGDLLRLVAQGMQGKNMDSLNDGILGASSHGRLLSRWTLGFVLFGRFCGKMRGWRMG
jgi:hypothetical protein